MTIPRRGLREIRTLSGRADQVVLPYKAYMQITCLEMEKLRRQREKNNARQRILDLDARLVEIEAEKELLLKAVGERNNAKCLDAAGAGSRSGHRASTGGLRLRY